MCTKGRFDMRKDNIQNTKLDFVFTYAICIRIHILPNHKIRWDNTMFFYDHCVASITEIYRGESMCETIKNISHVVPPERLKTLIVTSNVINTPPWLQCDFLVNCIFCPISCKCRSYGRIFWHCFFFNRFSGHRWFTVNPGCDVTFILWEVWFLLAIKVTPYNASYN